MTDYRITIKVQNGRLLRCMEKHGIKTWAELARLAELSYSQIIRVVDLKSSVIMKDGEYATGVIEVCQALNAMPSDLWSPDMLRAPMEKTAIAIDVSTEQLSAITDPADSSERLMLHSEATALFYSLLDQMPERNSRILRERFGLDGPPKLLHEIAHNEGVSKERARQLISNSLKQFRSLLSRRRLVEYSAKLLKGTTT